MPVRQDTLSYTKCDICLFALSVKTMRSFHLQGDDDKGKAGDLDVNGIFHERSTQCNHASCFTLHTRKKRKPSTGAERNLERRQGLRAKDGARRASKVVASRDHPMASRRCKKKRGRPRLTWSREVYKHARSTADACVSELDVFLSNTPAARKSWYAAVQRHSSII